MSSSISDDLDGFLYLSFDFVLAIVFLSELGKK